MIPDRRGSTADTGLQHFHRNIRATTIEQPRKPAGAVLMSELKAPEGGSWTESQVMMSSPEGGAWQENTLPMKAAQVFSPALTTSMHHGKRSLRKGPFSSSTFSRRSGQRRLRPPLPGPGRGAPSLGQVQSLCDAEDCGSSWQKGSGVNDASVHRSFVTDSAHLFLLYFLQLGVMATYLSQDQLKLVPLLTVLFCLGRLVYWVAAAFQSTIRAFGFGLCFLPSLVMMAANLYFLVTMEMSSGAFDTHHTEQAPPTGRQRFWG
ncbi:hypothetical protein WMY93_025808 [Mugilogobius chulae]|uniref:Transmembrane protein 79 n=1 Tax=Mugilogobius chulae TaxID=88201 RepID=A0AAW0MVP8_9GOBI